MIFRKLFKRYQLSFRVFNLSLILVFFCSSIALASQKSAKALLEDAKVCKEKLYKSSSKKKYRHNWERCLDKYESVYHDFPESSEAVYAMYSAGHLWAGLYGYSGRGSDIENAISLYRELVSRYSSHHLADDAQYQLGEIFYKYKKQPAQAYLEFLKVEIKFPDGDAKKEACGMMDKLEVVLGKKTPPKTASKEKQEELKRLTMVNDVRHWSTPTYTRVVIDLEKQAEYQEHLLKKDPEHEKPRRLFIDLRDACISKNIESPIAIKDGLLRRARAGQYDRETVRVVLDIEDMKDYKIFHLHDPFRIVVDVQGKNKRQKPVEVVAAKKPVERKEANKNIPKKQEVSLARQLGLGVRRVIIDAGHGGRDGGAAGKNGLREKDVVLRLAKIVSEKLRNKLNCQTILTREKDVFLPLEKRTAIANMKKADLFISLHANAHRNHSVQGIETYFLNIALDEESMNVAARENATSRKNISDLQLILNSLMLNTKINESSRLAEFVQKGMLDELQKRYKLKNRGVRQAPFYVLIGAEMPAILVEIGFITNSVENRRLKSAGYLDRVATGIVKGIDAYIKDIEMACKGG